MKIIVILHTVLIGNYITELKSEYTGNDYITVI